MFIIAIDHVQLAMPPGSEDKARAFYSGLLGVPEVAKPPELAKRGGAWFENGAVKIHLGVEEDFRAARKAHPAFVVDSFEALVSSLTNAGYDVKRDYAIDGVTRAIVHDPFGNRIELIERNGA